MNAYVTSVVRNEENVQVWIFINNLFRLFPIFIYIYIYILLEFFLNRGILYYILNYPDLTIRRALRVT